MLDNLTSGEVAADYNDFVHASVPVHNLLLQYLSLVSVLNSLGCAVFAQGWWRSHTLGTLTQELLPVTEHQSIHTLKQELNSVSCGSVHTSCLRLPVHVKFLPAPCKEPSRLVQNFRFF